MVYEINKDETITSHLNSQTNFSSSYQKAHTLNKGEDLKELEWYFYAPSKLPQGYLYRNEDSPDNYLKYLGFAIQKEWCRLGVYNSSKEYNGRNTHLSLDGQCIKELKSDKSPKRIQDKTRTIGYGNAWPTEIIYLFDNANGTGDPVCDNDTSTNDIVDCPKVNNTTSKLEDFLTSDCSFQISNIYIDEIKNPSNPKIPILSPDQWSFVRGEDLEAKAVFYDSKAKATSIHFGASNKDMTTIQTRFHGSIENYRCTSNIERKNYDCRDNLGFHS